MKKILYALLFGLVFCACSSDEGDEWSKGSIAGSVSDRTTGEPVATVNVTLSPGGRSTVTGSDGSFSFDELDPQDYTISISKEGYTPTTDKLTVKAGQPTAAHLLIERIPASITADRTLLDFGEELTTLSFRIVNTGYSDLAYKVEKGDCSWMSVDTETDILGYGKTATIVVKIDRQLLASGNNEAMIVVRSTSGGGNVEVKVKAIGEYRAESAVNTLDAEVSNQSAWLHGEIINEGAPAYTERGFVYDKQPTPTTTACIQKLSLPVNAEKKFMCRIEGLAPVQTYYARAYVVQKGVTIYGNIVSFRTWEEPTTLTTSAVTQIGASTATFNGTITNAGTPPYEERGFCYSRTDNDPTTNDNYQRVSGSGTGDFSLQVTGLDYPVTYYVRAYARMGGFLFYGNVVTFTTQQNRTSITTSAVTQVTATSATFNASIADAGLPAYTERGFCYSTTGTPTIADNRRRVSGSGTGDYSLQVTNLDYPVTYYVCAYAIQDGEAVYGNTVTFTTEFRDVAVSTSAATNVTESSARLNGTINDVGSPAYTQRGFVYSSTTTQPTIANDKVVQYLSWAGVFNETISGLQEGTTYYARAFAVQEGQYVYGNTISFTTGSQPRVQTGSVSSLTKTGTYFYQWSATFSGAVTAAGQPAYTERGFVYGETYDPTVGSGTKVIVSGRGTGAYSASASNIPDMKYLYMRAYVKAGNKYYYGQSVSFSTY